MDAAHPAEESTSELSFEAALARLEEIVRLLERGEAPLDQSIELYQEGDRLKRHCEARPQPAEARRLQGAFQAGGDVLRGWRARRNRRCHARLRAAQARIEQIAFGADGKPAGVKAFDGS